MLPRVILHNRVSLDGRVDWLDADLGVFYGIASLFNEDATLAGCDTLLNAYPNEQVKPACDARIETMDKDPNDKRPLLVVPDSKGRLRNWHLLRREEYWRDVIALCSHSTPRVYLDYLNEMEVDSIIAGDGQVDLRLALEELNGRYGVEVARVDSGGTLNGALLREGLVDEVSLLISPHLVGGLTPRSIFRARDLEIKDGVISLRLKQTKRLGGDVVWLLYDVVG